MFKKLVLGEGRFNVSRLGLGVEAVPRLDWDLATPFAVTVVELGPRRSGERGGFGIVGDFVFADFEGDGFLTTDDMVAFRPQCVLFS